jgi:hypothetical protein
MAAIPLTVGELLLDLENPRISKATSQREALQKIIEDQDLKLVVLAESIVDDGLNPMDRWLVIKSNEERGKYAVLEGNRRLATIKILINSAVMNDLEVRAPVKKKLEALSESFNLKAIEPIDCFDIGERQAAATWLSQRHTGENSGRGIVDWGGVATARFRGRDPALQAYELVLNYGGLTEDEKKSVEDRFPITTLDRLLSTPAVREKIGVEISDSKLKSDLPPTELIKPLRKMVLDLATGEEWNVTKLKSKDQQITYVSKFGKNLPNLKKRSGIMKAVDGLEDKDFGSARPKPRAKPKPPVRKTLIPRDCYLTVSNAKIAEITKELRSLSLTDYRHSISVLFRVFLETSVDHYLTSASVSLDVTVKGHKKNKSLRVKVDETIAEMVKNGTPKRNLDGVSKGINDKNSPLFHETLNNYVHNRFYSPNESELKVAWDNAQLFFENIWK